MRKIKMAIANEKTFAQGCEEFINNCCARNLRDGTIKHYKESIRQIGKQKYRKNIA
jgi:integrase/recombinase XerD